jgi:hypothetical protein
MNDDLNDPWKAGYDPHKSGKDSWKAGKDERKEEKERKNELIERVKKERARDNYLGEKVREERAREERVKNDELIIKARSTNISELGEKEEESAGAIKFDWNNWNTGGKVIFVTACVAILSMLMNWVDIGFTTRIGMSQETFLLLVFWIYPVLMLFKNKPISLLLGLVCAISSFVFTAIYISTKSVEILGEAINVSAIGAWVFLGASIALGVGIVKRNTVEIGGFDIKAIPRSLGIVFAFIFGGIGVLLLIHWLFDPEGDSPNIEVIAWFVFTVIAVRLGIIFGLFGEYARYTDRSPVLLTAKWFLIVVFATFVILLLGRSIIH